MMEKSVVMAVYNGEKYIIEQLTSIYNQSIPVQEVWICDDQSSDSTVAIVKEFIKSHHLEKNWTIIQNEKNLGYANNFMKALQYSTKELIFFCDQDDIWKKDRVQKMEKVMEEHTNVNVLGSEFTPFCTEKHARRVPKWELKQMKQDGSLEPVEFIDSNIFIGAQGCTMCVRKSFVDKILPYWHEDWAYDEFLWKLALCEQSLYMLHESTLKRREHANNTSLQKMHKISTRVKFLEDLYASHKGTIQYAKACGCSSQQLDLLEKNKKATRLRIELFTKKKIWNTIPLALFYLNCYHKKRAILRELVMAIRG